MREEGEVAVGTKGTSGVWIFRHKPLTSGKSNRFQEDKVLTDTSILRKQSLSLNTVIW